jgi:hypothetical protein
MFFYKLLKFFHINEIKRQKPGKKRLIEKDYKSQKRLIASQLIPRKGRDIKCILIENIYSLFLNEKYFQFFQNFQQRCV